ncbi:MAG: OsmC family protein [Leptolinea sp.]|jgi:putative redox protein|nr:OsmC family protein [Leptolinea sp.]
MEAKVVWKNGMTFAGTSESGFSVPMGTSSDLGGADDGFRPMELIAIGLAGCTGMDVISILSKKKQKVTNFEVRIHAEKATEHPKVFTGIEVEYYVTGEEIDKAAVERAVELSITKYCPAQAMLSKAVPITHKITIH